MKRGMKMKRPSRILFALVMTLVCCLLLTLFAPPSIQYASADDCDCLEEVPYCDCGEEGPDGPIECAVCSPCTCEPPPPPSDPPPKPRRDPDRRDPEPRPISEPRPATQPLYTYTDPTTGLTVTVEGLPWGVMIVVIDPSDGDAIALEDYLRFAAKIETDYEGKMIIVLYDIILIEYEQDDRGNIVLDEDGRPVPKLDEDGNPVLYTLPPGTSITLTITGDVLKNLDSEGVLVLHEQKDGEMEEIPHSYDPETGTIVFSAGSFSLYGVLADNPDYVVPATGVTTWLIPAVIGLVGSGAALCSFAVISRKKRV